MYAPGVPEYRMSGLVPGFRRPARKSASVHVGRQSEAKLSDQT